MTRVGCGSVFTWSGCTNELPAPHGKSLLALSLKVRPYGSARAIHLPHAAFTDRGGDGVGTEGGAGLQKHPNFSRAYCTGVAPAGAPAWVTATAVVDW